MVVSQLQAAMGVLISCEPFVPCIGMLPNSEFLKLHEVAAYKYELCTLANMLVSTLSKIESEASVNKYVVVCANAIHSVIMAYHYTLILYKIHNHAYMNNIHHIIQ